MNFLNLFLIYFSLSPLLLTFTLDRLAVLEFDWVDYDRVDFERVPYMYLGVLELCLKKKELDTDFATILATELTPTSATNFLTLFMKLSDSIFKLATHS